MAKEIFSGGPKLTRFTVLFGLFVVGVHFAYAMYDLGTWNLGTMIVDLAFAALVLWGALQMANHKKVGWMVNCVLGALMLIRGLGGSVTVSTELTFFQALQPYLSFLVGLVFLVALFPLRSYFLSK